MNKLPEELHPMVLENLGLVRSIAWRMSLGLRDPALSFDDLYSIGCLGLMHAVMRFDPAQGFTFSTYAYPAIWGYVASSLTASSTVKVPRHIRQLADRIRRNDLYKVDSGEIAARFGRPVEYVDHAKYYLRLQVVPLNDKDDETFNVADLYAREEMDASAIIVSEFLKQFPPIGRIRKRGELVRLMLASGLNAAEAGQQLGMSRQAAHVHLKAVRKAWHKYAK